MHSTVAFGTRKPSQEYHCSVLVYHFSVPSLPGPAQALSTSIASHSTIAQTKRPFHSTDAQYRHVSLSTGQCIARAAVCCFVVDPLVAPYAVRQYRARRSTIHRTTCTTHPVASYAVQNTLRRTSVPRAWQYRASCKKLVLFQYQHLSFVVPVGPVGCPLAARYALVGAQLVAPYACSVPDIL
eukprot:3701437-Rhodomonas_salina.2